MLSHGTTTTTTVLRPFLWHYPGELVPEEKLLDFMAQGEINRGSHTDHPAGHHSIRTNQCPPPSSPLMVQNNITHRKLVLWQHSWALGPRKTKQDGYKDDMKTSTGKELRGQQAD